MPYTHISDIIFLALELAVTIFNFYTCCQYSEQFFEG